MRRIDITLLLALSALALPTSTALAQVFQGLEGGADRSNQGGVTEDKSVPLCQGAAGGSRMRENCDVETETLRAEQELKPLLIEIPALDNKECSATTTTEYYQSSAVARVNSTLKITDCTAASGEFTVALRLKEEGAEDTLLEFNETWQRSDDQDVKFTAEYPIGESAELASVRVRRLSCTCADAADTSTDPADTTAASDGSSQ